MQLDSGAQAFATVNGGSVSNSTPAGTLRQGSVDPNLLASTPDANTTDPFVQEEAAKLNYDPTQIFNYLHDDVAYNSYTGSLRGARGTLWSSAGNTLDVASLGVALMRASGIPAQYVEGTLSQSQAQQLILSMFPASYQMVGYIPPGTQTSDPANDPQLLSETEQHYWFQFDTGSGMQDADPLMAGASIGQTFTAATGTFTEIADKLRAKTEVKLTAEIYSQASAAFGVGNGLTDTVVLDQTFNDVDLVGRTLVLGNYVTTSEITSPVFSSATTTYSPYLIVDQNQGTLGSDPLYRGTDFQEVMTNFPLGSELVTGLSLDITTSGPGAAVQTVEKTLYDRIGFAARHSGSSVSISVSPVLLRLSPTDVTVFDVSAASPPAAALAQETQAATALANQILALPPPSGGEATQSVQSEQTVQLTASSEEETGSLIAETFLAESASAAELLSSSVFIKSYFAAPQIIAVTAASSVDSTTGRPSAKIETDILQDLPRAYAAPNQLPQFATGYLSAHGISDGVVEGEVLGGTATPGPSTGMSSFDIVSAALASGTPLVEITQSNLSALTGLNLSAEALARITQAVEEGAGILVPASMITVNGTPSIAWLQIDLQTDNCVFVLQDGAHADEFEYPPLEFPTKSGHGVKLYSVCSYAAGETYPSDECLRFVL